MKNAVIIVFVALAAVALLLFIYNPELLEKIYLWIIGLIGLIISVIKNAISGIADFFRDDEKDKRKEDSKAESKVESKQSETSTPSEIPPIRNLEDRELIASLETKISELENDIKNLKEEDDFNGTTLNVLRYFDDGETTLGLLFLDNKFFCYTLQDTYRKIKVAGKTRIPKGIYTIDFNRNETPLTLKYRKTRPWFVYHLHVKNVSGFKGIYIHSGSTHLHTEGCLLVARSIYSDDAKSSIFNSKVTFKELYTILKSRLDGGEKVRIRYFDEDFMSSSILKNKAS